MSQQMRSPSQYLALLSHLGPSWLLYRAGYTARWRFGLLRRASPISDWEQMPAPAVRLGVRSLPAAISKSSEAGCVQEADAVLRGGFCLFSHRPVMAPLPPDWHRNQLTGEQLPVDRHWTELGDFSFGDIKGVWELSRFPWAFALARAYGRTGDARYVDTFWRLLADWCVKNPPNTGSNWMCGQEATFRLMAVVFAAEACGVPESQRTGLARFIVASGQRIAANLEYALSQQNNHGVSECVGLITVALLVPRHTESAGWLVRGLRGLETQLAELVYEDGGFSQHSLIYHRVLLHDLCWCRHRLTESGQSVPVWLDAAGWRALDFLMTLVDPDTGLAPLYGANDGANVLPLADAEFLDMRPAVQMTAAVFRQELPLPEGPWDEAAAWLAPEWSTMRRVSWPAVPVRWHARAAGCFQLVNGAGRLFLRCPEKFRHRPGQADMLHVDISYAGRPVAVDGGSFSYNSRERFTVLGQAAHHNVLTLDGREPLEKFSRFLYLPWPEGQACAKADGVFQATHDGYAKIGVHWTREVSSRSGGGFIIQDRVVGAAGHLLAWHWRLADASWRMSVDAVEADDHQWSSRVSWRGPAGIEGRLSRAESDTAHGWWSPHYGEAVPAYSLRLKVQASADVELVTEFGPVA